MKITCVEIELSKGQFEGYPLDENVNIEKLLSAIKFCGFRASIVETDYPDNSFVRRWCTELIIRDIRKFCEIGRKTPKNKRNKDSHIVKCVEICIGYDITFKYPLQKDVDVEKLLSDLRDRNLNARIIESAIYEDVPESQRSDAELVLQDIGEFYWKIDMLLVKAIIKEAEENNNIINIRNND